MKASLTGFALLAGAALLAAAIGCGQQQQASAPATESHEHTSKEVAHGGAEQGMDAAGGMTQHHETGDIQSNLAKLSPQDRMLAEIQKMCPVSGAPLGEMGAPIKVTVNGKDIFVCCQECVDPIKSDFEKYAAKLVERQ